MSEFVMPSLGSNMIDAKLVNWFVEVGDTVKRGDIIGEIDTEKGLIDIEVFEDGIITELVAEVGETIPVGSVMAVINERTQQVETAAKSISEQEHAPHKTNGKKKAPAATKARKRAGGGIKASPLARRVAEDLDVDLSKVEGSGSGGVIHRKDVEAYAQKAREKESKREEGETGREQAPEPEIKAKKEKESGPADLQKSMRQAIAAAMSRSNRDIPHYYLETEIDIKATLDWLETTNRQRSVNERLFPPMVFIKAVANALTEVPRLNGFWTDDELQIAESVHVGFAISLRQGGLVIPALLDADLKSLEEIRSDFLDLIKRAREGHLKTREVSSATITITSLGERGADKVYGVIYPPQVALVGFGKITERPRAMDGLIGIRPVLNAVVAGDHRATDGHTGSLFLEKLNDQLQHPETL